MGEVLKTLDFENDKEKFNDAWIMEDHYESLDSLWGVTDSAKTGKIKAFCDLFNTTWDHDPEQKLFVKVFDSTSEIYDFIIGNFDDVFEEVIEEELEMRVDKFQFMCENAYTEPLMNKNFIKILNARMPICF